MMHLPSCFPLRLMAIFCSPAAAGRAPEAALVRLSAKTAQLLVSPCVSAASHPIEHVLMHRHRGAGKKSNSQPL